MNRLEFVNTHIVDLRKSVWDKKASDLKAGELVATKIVYVKHRGPNRDPDWKLRWVHYDPPYRDYIMEKAMYGVKPVTYKDNTFFPEGCEVNAEGYFQFGDVILVKEPILQYLQRRKEAVDRGEAGAKAHMEQFKGESAEQGVDVTYFGLDK